MNWWHAVTLLEKILYILASASTLILIIQTILAIFGIGEDSFDSSAASDAGDMSIDGAGDVDLSEPGLHPLDMSGIQILTIRGVMSFFSIGGWVAIICLHNKINVPLSLLIGFISGLVIMVLLAKIMQMSMKLQSSGNININNAIGQQGMVYLIIPPKGKGQGKVNVVIQERLREFEAITESDDSIPTGTGIVVKRIMPPDILVVEKI